MAEILTKSEFAAKLGVNLSAVSNYIARGKLTAPALRPDGTVDSSWRCGSCALGWIWRVVLGWARPAQQPLSAPGNPSSGRKNYRSSAPMVRARAVSAAVAAERARRKLSPETGKYLVGSRLPANGERRCQDPARYRGGPLQKIYTGQASVLGGRASAAHTGSGSQIAVVSRAAWPPDLAASMGREVTMVYPIPFAP